MRQKFHLFDAFTMALTVILTLVVCWQGLSTPPQCDYDCIRTVGPGNCKEKVENAAEYHKNPDCLGIGKCHPASGQIVSHSHEVLDTCRTSTERYHLQHITTIGWDTDNDGRKDTICNALHSCP